MYLPVSNRELLRYARDLVALSTLPATLRDYDEPETLARRVASALLAILRCDLVAIEVNGAGEPFVTHVAHHFREKDAADFWRRTGEALLERTRASEKLLPFKEPGGEVEFQVIGLPLGFSGQEGRIVVASSTKGFPFDIDRILLGVGANQAAVALENARLYRDVQREIRERRRAEEEALRLGRVVEQSDDAIMILALDGTCLAWNGGAEKTFGYPRDEILGRSCSMMFPDELREVEKTLRERLGRGEHIGTYETRYRRKDARIIEVSVTASSLKDAEGRVTGICKIVRDITELKEAQERLAFLAEASTILSSSLDFESTICKVADVAVRRLADWCAVSILDSDRRIRTIAAAHRDPAKTGWVKEFTHRHAPDPDARYGIANVLRTGRPELYREIPPEQLQGAVRDGDCFRLFWEIGVLSSMHVPLIAEGKPVGAITFHAAESGRRYGEDDLDLAMALATRASLALENARLYRQAKRAEQDVRRLNASLERTVEERTRELRETVQELEAFSYTVAHDLRAPLRAMHGFADLVLRDAGDRLEAGEREYLKRINRAASRMDALVGGLLAYSRLSRVQLERELIDLHAVVREVLDRMSRELRDQKAEVVLEEGIPPVLGHRVTLIEVVANLVSNAAKFVAPGIEPRIRIAAQTRSGWVRLTVEDNGIGIDSGHREKLFGVFERLHGTDAYPGTGVGLAIVKRSIERMGGRVGQESREGQGSVFWFELPDIGSALRAERGTGIERPGPASKDG